MADSLNGTHVGMNGSVIGDNNDDAAEASPAKLPPEDAHGRPRHESLDGEARPSGVRRIRAGRVLAAAAGVGLVTCLALGYGLTPPQREQKPTAVKIDVRKQQGELPSPPGLSLPADVNYATATQPPKPAAPPKPPAGYAALTAGGQDEPPAAADAPAVDGEGDPRQDQLRQQHAELREALAQAQAQLHEQMERTQQDMEAQRERAQASLDAPIGFANFKPAQPREGEPATAGAGSAVTAPNGVGSPLNPLVVTPRGDAAINPNEVQPRDVRSNLQTEKIAFLNSAEKGLDTYLRTGPTGPVAAQHELSAGTVVPGFTVTAINSDLPGKVVGRVSSDLYDSATGRYVLIPQGSVAVGEYSSLVSNGQNRLLVAWEMLTFPDGRSIDLQRQPGTDAAGASGLADRVDYHWRQLLLAGGLSTAVAVGGELAEGDNSGFGSTENVEEQLRELVFGGASDTAARIANKIIDRQLDVQPTITVRPGWRFNILLTRNLVLEPYVDSRR